MLLHRFLCSYLLWLLFMTRFLAAMEKRNNRPKGTFTHFMSIPFISQQSRSIFRKYQDQVTSCFQPHERKALQENNPNLFHITISMLSLTQESKVKAKAAYQRVAPQLRDILRNTDLAFSELRYFQRGRKPYEGINVLFLDIVQDESFAKVMKCADLLVREFVKDEIIFPQDFKSMHMTYDHNTGLYKPGKLHLTMFRIDENRGKDVDFKTAIEAASKLTVSQRLPIDFVDISTRFEYDASKFYTPLERVQIEQKKTEQKQL